MLLLSNEDVRQVLDMRVCLDALDKGYHDLVNQDAGYGFRTSFYAPSARPDEAFRFDSMQGAAKSTGVFAIRIKLDILYWPEGKTEEKYCIQPGTFCGLILIVSLANAEPLALIQDGYLQHMRVGGCAGLGTRYLARGNAKSVGMIGSGGMARSFLESFACVRDIGSARVYSPTREHREAYAREMSQKLEIPVQAVDTPEEAVRGTDIFSVCTDARVQVMSADWLEPGMHLATMGGGVDPRVHERSDVIFKLGWGAPDTDVPISEGGGAGQIYVGRDEEIAHIPNLRRDRSTRRSNKGYPLLTDLITGRVPGRTSDSQITYFMDEGTQGLQFAAVGGTVYHLAKDRGLGRQIPNEWLLETIRD
jgi:ornithine cyclodeaminase/alanine dehydrogenase-like protein (mu-crystallin family)